MLTDRCSKGRLPPTACIAAAGLAVLVACLAYSASTRLVWPVPDDGAVVRQSGRLDCGPAALKMIFDHYQIASDVEEIALAAGLGTSGTNLLALKRVAEARSLVATGMRLSIGELRVLPMPVIAHMDENHFVVVRSAGDEFLVDDPSVGRLKMGARAFTRSWTGVIMVFERKTHGAPDAKFVSPASA
ncbi:MAG: hypothetical protein F4210_04475 [Holophagales bacterium]|nr:hypothetical protein [Holophagales bacterium]MYF94760.1 hypothetical protein [Holophagales bacterium]